MKLPYGYVLAGKEITAHEEKTDAEMEKEKWEEQKILQFSKTQSGW